MDEEVKEFVIRKSKLGKTIDDPDVTVLDIDYPPVFDSIVDMLVSKHKVRITDKTNIIFPMRFAVIFDYYIKDDARRIFGHTRIDDDPDAYETYYQSIIANIVGITGDESYYYDIMDNRLFSYDLFEGDIKDYKSPMTLHALESIFKKTDDIDGYKIDIRMIDIKSTKYNIFVCEHILEKKHKHKPEYGYERSIEDVVETAFKDVDKTLIIDEDVL